MNKRFLLLFDLLILFIITIPTFTSILNNQYFTIHDNQHVVRLYLLDRGIRQGYLYPRWVDGLSFGFGDPLFNFYPPLVYYLGEFFHILGFSFIWSIKLVFIFGFFTASLSMYFLARSYFGRRPAILASTIYSYFFYHAVNAYVRGALSEFFAMSFLPLVFLAFYKFSRETNLKNGFFLGFSLSLIILSHQLVALPLVFFLVIYFIFYFLRSQNKSKFIRFGFCGGLLGLALSAFYFLPMFYERKFTFLDAELGGYKIHFIDPYQFWYSAWGYGASVAGAPDGMTFQLGKVVILMLIFSLILFIVYFIKSKKKDNLLISHFLLFLILVFFGLWMTTVYSSFIWNNLKLLWNLQFPWRFLSITAVFIALLSSIWLVFLDRIIPDSWKKKLTLNLLMLFFVCLFIVKYSPYFKPQSYLNIKDTDLLTKDQIQWVQSQTVLHFVPRGVKARKNEYGVYVLDINKKDLPKDIYKIKAGNANVKIVANKFQEKEFQIKVASKQAKFQLNTFHFPGWIAYLDNKKINIEDDNAYKLMNITVPIGAHRLKFVFEDTLVRKVGNSLSFFSFIVVILFGKKFFTK